MINIEKKLTLTIIVVLLMGSISFAGAFAKPQIYALVVGVSEYQQPVLNKLRYAQSDALAFSELLGSPSAGSVPEKNIILLQGQKATRREILKCADELFRKRAQEGDMIIFYFSGHGMASMGDGYLMPYEGEREDALSSGVSMEQIFRVVNSSPAKVKSVYIDACHAGLFPKNPGTKSLPGEQNAATSVVFNNLFKAAAPGLMAVLSSRGNEESIEAPGLKKGLFTHYLLKGLEGEADNNTKDGVVTAKELEDYLVKEVSSYSGYAQRPLVKGNIDPNFPLSVSSAELALSNLIQNAKNVKEVVPILAGNAIEKSSPKPSTENLSNGMKFDGRFAYGQATFINNLGYPVVLYAIRGPFTPVENEALLSAGEQLKTSRIIIERKTKLEDCQDLYASYTFCFRITKDGVKQYAFIERLLEVGKNIYFELNSKNTLFQPGNGYSY